MKEWQSQAQVKWECKYHVVSTGERCFRERAPFVFTAIFWGHEGPCSDVAFGREGTVPARSVRTKKVFGDTLGTKRSSKKNRNSWG